MWWPLHTAVQAATEAELQAQSCIKQLQEELKLECATCLTQAGTTEQ